jgi:hypothetical protein
VAGATVEKAIKMTRLVTSKTPFNILKIRFTA